MPFTTELQSPLSCIGRVLAIISDAILWKPFTPTRDGIYEYAHLFCHYASLAFVLRNPWGLGNGDTVYMCWKVLLMYFYDDRCMKYAWEAFKLQFRLANLPPTL